ncbi:MAG: hypothetical protein Q8K00_03400 [Syntrophales bacterium]|nr:hypothetical protein [Syntrophales bacterium]
MTDTVDQKNAPCIGDAGQFASFFRLSRDISQIMHWVLNLQ